MCMPPTCTTYLSGIHHVYACASVPTWPLQAVTWSAVCVHRNENHTAFGRGGTRHGFAPCTDTSPPVAPPRTSPSPGTRPLRRYRPSPSVAPLSPSFVSKPILTTPRAGLDCPGFDSLSPPTAGPTGQDRSQPSSGPTLADRTSTLSPRPPDPHSTAQFHETARQGACDLRRWIPPFRVWG